jgi:hypothetical protein
LLRLGLLGCCLRLLATLLRCLLRTGLALCLGLSGAGCLERQVRQQRELHTRDLKVSRRQSTVYYRLLQ